MTNKIIQNTFLWHDYETFGSCPNYDRPSSFAAIRTDLNLNILDKEITQFCKPTPDYLPEPLACLITKITPQYCLEKGFNENDFAKLIESFMSQAGTINVGYNNVRFDDEITRFLFWRNLIDPYAREWQNNCSRWDLLDVVRLTYALRPEGINFPITSEGKVSFKLENLAKANNIYHEAHDALSDVRATIEIAKLIKKNQPKLFDFALNLRYKNEVLKQMSLPNVLKNSQPFLHISGQFPAENGCLTIMIALASHPINKNEIICWDLKHNPSQLVNLTAEEIKENLFTKKTQNRLAIKNIHINKSPMVIGNVKTLNSEMANKWQIDLNNCFKNVEIAQSLPDLSSVWKEVFPAYKNENIDVDLSLYQGFLGNEDRSRLNYLRDLSPEELALDKTGFDDLRLSELVFRFRARNFPETLNDKEAEKWKIYCEKKLIKGFEIRGKVRNLENLQIEIDELIEKEENQTEVNEEILGKLTDYLTYLLP